MVYSLAFGGAHHLHDRFYGVGTQLSVLISTELILLGTVTYFETLQREHLVFSVHTSGHWGAYFLAAVALSLIRAAFRVHDDSFPVLMLHRGPPARWLASEPRLTHVSVVCISSLVVAFFAFFRILIVAV
jgi:hypothetical protein